MNERNVQNSRNVEVASSNYQDTFTRVLSFFLIFLLAGFIIVINKQNVMKSV